jgi:hypothetical protein
MVSESKQIYKNFFWGGGANFGSTMTGPSLRGLLYFALAASSSTVDSSTQLLLELQPRSWAVQCRYPCSLIVSSIGVYCGFNALYNTGANLQDIRIRLVAITGRDGIERSLK